MRIAVSCLLCLMLSAPVNAQQSQERQHTERKAVLFFWTGVAAASTGATAMFAAPSIGVPFVAGGGAMMFYGVHLRRRAKQMPFTTFHVVPFKKGVALGLSRSCKAS